MMNVTIRKMCRSDIDQVCAIESAVFSDAWSEIGFTEGLANANAIMLVAVLDGSLRYLPGESADASAAELSDTVAAAGEETVARDVASDYGTVDDGETAVGSEIVVGYSCLYGVLDEGELAKVAVHPDDRRRGVGEMLVRAMLTAASVRGIERCYLEVRESNFAARRLYVKLGFEPVGVRKRFYEKPTEDAVVMLHPNLKRIGTGENGSTDQMK